MYIYISLNEDLKIHNIWENCEFNTMFILSDSVFVMMERSQPGPNGKLTGRYNEFNMNIQILHSKIIAFER